MSESSIPLREKSGRIAWGILGASLGVWGFLALRTNFLIDDAFISFRYAKLWAETGVPTYEPTTQPPVEGYSNFLWVVLLRIAHGLGSSLETASRILSVLFGAGTILLLWRFLRERGLAAGPLAVGCFALAASPPFAVWTTGGLETASFGFFLFAAFLALIRPAGFSERWQGALAGLLGLAVALSRAEGFVWVLVIAACSWLTLGRATGGSALRKQRFVPYFLIYLLGYGAFLLWRQSVYGEWMANTAHAKAGLSYEVFLRGLKTTASYLLILITPLAVLVALPFSVRAADDRRALAVGVTGMFLAGLGYNTLVGGDWMPFFRFLAPLTPFLAILAALVASCCRASTWSMGGFVAVGMLPLFDIVLSPRAILEPLYFRGFVLSSYETEQQRWAKGIENLEAFSDIGRALGQIATPEDSITFGAIGAIGWYSGLKIHDRNGLVDREVARRPKADANKSAGHDKQVSRAFFLEREPTLFHAVFLRGPRTPEAERNLLGLAVNRVFGSGPEENALRRACLPEVHVIREEGETRPGTLLVLRATDDSRRAEAYWERVLGP